MGSVPGVHNVVEGHNDCLGQNHGCVSPLIIAIWSLLSVRFDDIYT